MKKRINLLGLFFLTGCFLYANVAMAQDSLKTWKDKIEYLKNKLPNEGDKGDGKDLILINYAYKGVIDSESVKSAIIDSVFSPNAPSSFQLPPIVVVDTTYSGDMCIITEKRFPKFEITTVGRVTEIMDSLSMETHQEELRQALNNIIQVGWEYLETEWDYKGYKYKSTTIVTDQHGGFIYDPVSSLIVEGRSTTKIPISDLHPLQP